MEFNQNLNMPRLFTTAVISVVVLVVLMLGTQAWYENAQETEIDYKARTSPPSEYAELKEQQRDSLERISWSSDKKVAATLPIEQAMALLIKNGGKLPSTQP